MIPDDLRERIAKAIESERDRQDNADRAKPSKERQATICALLAGLNIAARIARETPLDAAKTGDISMTYEVEFERNINARNGAFEMKRCMTLPFIPFLGMDILDLFFNGDWFKVADVAYWPDRDIFLVDEEGGDTKWDGDFDLEQAAYHLKYGCKLDGHTDLDRWKSEVFDLVTETKDHPPQ